MVFLHTQESAFWFLLETFDRVYPFKLAKLTTYNIIHHSYKIKQNRATEKTLYDLLLMVRKIKILHFKFSATILRNKFAEIQGRANAFYDQIFFSRENRHGNRNLSEIRLNCKESIFFFLIAKYKVFKPKKKYLVYLYLKLTRSNN